ncbi:aldehyde dehydrogenase family protein [Haematobacter massiliensis]|uniref:aldehyde dehydrogenase family protein n=2 Tax=Haematobacter massiliensis TaxID=195105 RepID=UPI000A049605|nr:aldehyde dehydrogenase family protein [Haematobacter massiliensis]QBJ25452.1 aldehyde dehydrogenase family protein [Haematobacter massiliensis]
MAVHPAGSRRGLLGSGSPVWETLLTAWAIARCLLDAGVTPQAVSLLWGQAAEISEALIAAPEIHKVSRIGSTRVGRITAAAAGPALRKSTTEPGGHGPVIVAADAVAEPLCLGAARNALWRRNGQRLLRRGRYRGPAILFHGDARAGTHP